VRAYRIAYDGHDYRGFQRQPDVPTVSDAVLDALQALALIEEGAVPPGYAAAGRTDAGVSATAQTVAFEGPDWLDPAALNSELPPDVRAWAGADVPPDFHATHDASAREYTYYLHADEMRAPDAAGGPLDDATVSRTREALDRLAGEHDFHNLTPDGTGTVRTLDLDCRAEDTWLVLTVRADGFPRQLVRRLVTVVAEFARGASGRDRLDHLLGRESVAGPAGVPPAAPEPLVLTGVAYPGVDFRRDEAAAASARTVFRERCRDLSTRAQVAARLADR
jgi:tRNA pseudouridine38-40 synthase